MMRALGVIVIVSLLFGRCPAGTVPQEPEADNGEFLLDVATNDYSRIFREIWDGGDNRFRFRLGSNNVRQWFIEEELKFSATLLENRLRFRYHHARLLRYSSNLLSRDALEFELRVRGRNYLSFFGTPTFAKGKNSVGVLLQHRIKVDQYVIFAIELPHFWRNFTERKSEATEDLSIFTDRPIRLAVDLRQPLGPSVWLRFVGEVIPEFEMGTEDPATGIITPVERARGGGFSGWIEYVWGRDRPLPDQSACGIDLGYRSQEKEIPPGVSANPSIVLSVGPPPVDPNRSDGLSHEFDREFYTPTEGDTVTAWRESRGYVEPRAWIALGERWTARASLRLEERRIEWRRTAGGAVELENRYVVPAVGARVGLGRSKAAVLEGGLVAQYRWRKDRRRDGAPPSGMPEVRCEDHRAYIAFEYHFGPDKIIRLVEAIELDAEDMGQFRIHDHGFFQVVLGF